MSNHDNLSAIRRQSGLTANRVAALMDVSPATVSTMERQAGSPRVDTLAMYYAAVGRMDLAHLLKPAISEARWVRIEAAWANRAARVAEWQAADTEADARTATGTPDRRRGPRRW